MKATSEQFVKAYERAINDGIVCEKLDRYWIVTSASEPGRVHKVYLKPNTLCDCTGYWRYKCCKHLALVITTSIERGEAWVCYNCGEVLLTPLTSDIYAFHDAGECIK